MESRSDVELVRAAVKAYGARLMVPCPACGAPVGARCTTIGGATQRRLDQPHRTRKAADGPRT